MDHREDDGVLRGDVLLVARHGLLSDAFAAPRGERPLRRDKKPDETRDEKFDEKFDDKFDTKIDMNALEALSMHLVPAVMVLARVSGMAVQGPLLSSSAIPMRIKALLVASLGLAVYPTVATNAELPSSVTLGMAAGLVILEFGIGVFIGFMASMPLYAAQFGGLFMGQQIGLGFARFYNPAIGDESDALEQIFFFLALAVFLSLGGLESMVSAVVGSFTSVPATAVPAMLAGAPGASPLAIFTGALSAAFELGLRVAMPLLAIVCLETVVMGYLSRSVPQLNIMSIGFPMRIILGLAVIIASLAAIDETIVDGTVGTLEALLLASGAESGGGA